MGQAMLQGHKKTLVDFGMKEALVEKLDDAQAKDIVAFAMDNPKGENLLQMLIQLASMEIRNKRGAAYLACHGIANTIQLKNLNGEQIEQIVDDYQSSADDKLAIKAVKDAIVANQQEKLYMQTDGMKGEFYEDIAHQQNSAAKE